MNFKPGGIQRYQADESRDDQVTKPRVKIMFAVVVAIVTFK